MTLAAILRELADRDNLIEYRDASWHINHISVTSDGFVLSRSSGGSPSVAAGCPACGRPARRGD